MSKLSKRYIASLSQVRISRKVDYAVIEYLEPGIPGTNLMIGPEISCMTDQEILDQYNGILEAIEERKRTTEYVATEIPPGKPQIEYSARSDQWVPRGDVLRCEITDGGPERELAVIIDDRELSLREFGRCLTTYAGWGMRIVFVPDDELTKPPTTVCLDPPGEDQVL